MAGCVRKETISPDKPRFGHQWLAEGFKQRGERDNVRQPFEGRLLTLNVACGRFCEGYPADMHERPPSSG